MRELKIEEARFLISKFIKFKGNKIFEFIKSIYFNFSLFRLQKNRIFFCASLLYYRAINFYKKNLGSIGSCIGRFTHSRKFYFLIPALNLLIKNQKFFSIFTNSMGEKQFIFGNNLKKEKILKLSKNIFESDGVILIGMNSLPIGFGESLKSTILLPKVKNCSLLVINHSDIGRYIRIL
jgi:60S ribosome subunit biogenesis protein NIP7